MVVVYRNTNNTHRLHEFEEHKMFSAIQNCRGTRVCQCSHFHLLSSFFVDVVVVALNENMISNCVCTSFSLLHSILLFDQRPPSVVVMVNVVHCRFVHSVHIFVTIIFDPTALYSSPCTDNHRPS